MELFEYIRTLTNLNAEQTIYFHPSLFVCEWDSYTNISNK